MKIVAIIQARMGSTRLPGKIMKEVLGKPILWYVVERVKKSKKVTDVIVATSANKEDDVVEEYLEKLNVKVYRGSDSDVLARYYGAAKSSGADAIVRVTSDCPVIDPDLIDEMIELFMKEPCDYASNTVERTFPDGLDVEVFTFKALEKAYNEATIPIEREHVTPYIWKNPRLFKSKQLKDGQDFSHYRWTIDWEQDYVLIKKIYTMLKDKGPFFKKNDIMDLYHRHPELTKINMSMGT
jgi:spore coat polysaccharide biosynthesis protein SpsF